ncbi:MAG: DnaA/Hda family protein [Thermomicrobiales bacterium]
MKRIGDVLTTVRIPTGPPRSNGAAKREQPAWRCPVCKDAGWVRMDVPVGHPNFGRLFPCECKVAEQAERGREQVRRLSNLDGFNQHTFAHFEATPGTEEAYNAAREFARNPDGWLYLHGSVGVGKTHLAVASALEIRERNGSVLFAVVPDLLDHLRTTFDPSQGLPTMTASTPFVARSCWYWTIWGRRTRRRGRGRSSTRSSTTAMSSGCPPSLPPTRITVMSTSASSRACWTRT